MLRSADLSKPRPPVRGGPSTLRRALLTVPVLLMAATCGAAEPEAVFRVPVTVETDRGPQIFQAEIADSPSERSRGLMFRESMDDKHGMIFLFPAAQQQSFWMKNTLIPLDIIFIRADRTILGIAENAEPMTMTGRRVEGRSQFVLEINGGLSAKLGIRAGQKVSFMAPLPDR